MLRVREPSSEQPACLACTVSQRPKTKEIQFCCAGAVSRVDVVVPQFRADPANSALPVPRLRLRPIKAEPLPAVSEFDA